MYTTALFLHDINIQKLYANSCNTVGIKYQYLQSRSAHFSWFRQHKYFNFNQGACGTLVYVCGKAYFILYAFIHFAYEAAPYDESPIPIRSTCTNEILQSYSYLTAKLEL